MNRYAGKSARNRGMWLWPGCFIILRLPRPSSGRAIMEQLTGAAHALELKLSEETLKKLDEIWPGPGGEAPEAYAW